MRYKPSLVKLVAIENLNIMFVNAGTILLLARIYGRETLDRMFVMYSTGYSGRGTCQPLATMFGYIFTSGHIGCVT